MFDKTNAYWYIKSNMCKTFFLPKMNLKVVFRSFSGSVVRNCIFKLKPHYFHYIVLHASVFRNAKLNVFFISNAAYRPGISVCSIHMYAFYSKITWQRNCTAHWNQFCHFARLRTKIIETELWVCEEKSVYYWWLMVKFYSIWCKIVSILFFKGQPSKQQESLFSQTFLVKIESINTHGQSSIYIIQIRFIYCIHKRY